MPTASTTGLAFSPSISAMSGPDGSRVESGDRAMSTLRRAIAKGFRTRDHMAKDTDLDALRSRRDFQLLMLDLAFPSSPFAREEDRVRRGDRSSI